MRRMLRSLLLATVTCILAGPSLVRAQAPEIPEDVKTSIHTRVDHEYNVSIIVGVVNPQGTQYYSYGRMDLSSDRKPDETTVFEIGSISKVFTSLLLADMVERGELAFDDPIERHLPHTVSAPTRGGKSITLLHLATHRSGLPRMPDNFSPADPANPYADYSVEQMYEFLSGHTLRRDIGAEYEYSNYGAGLLGHILSLRGAMSYDDLVRQRIANELGMEDTRISLTPDMRQRLATGHAGMKAVANWDIPTLAGAGALRSTARDMLTFLAANMGLKPSGLYSAMQTTHQSRHDAGSAQMRIGLGWHIRMREDREIIWHNGGTGGYRSFIGFLRDEPTGVVVLTNTSTSADDIGFHLLDPSIPLREIRVPVEVAPAILESYVGRYELRPEVAVDIAMENGRLTLQVTGQSRFPLYAASETEFFLTVVNAQVTFQKDEQGAITSLVVHQGGVDRTARKLPPEEKPSQGTELTGAVSYRR